MLALGAGTAFVLGVLATWGQAREAALPPAEVVPLTSMGELVALGAQALTTALVGVPVALVLAYVAHLILTRGGLRPAVLDRGVPDRLAEARQRVARDLAVQDDLPPIDDTAPERRARRLEARARRRRAALRRRLWFTRAVVLGGLLLALAFGGPAHLLAAGAGVWAMERFGATSLHVAATVLAVLLVAVGAERFLAPDPLPDAAVRTTTGSRLVKGPLVSSSGQAWHVLVAPGRIKSVPAGQVAKSSVALPPPRGSRILSGSLLGRIL